MVVLPTNIFFFFLFSFFREKDASYNVWIVNSQVIFVKMEKMIMVNVIDRNFLDALLELKSATTEKPSKTDSLTIIDNQNTTLIMD